MESYLNAEHYDLITPDGIVTSIQNMSDKTAIATVFIKNISQAFVGFQIEPSRVFFNIKSTLAQLGIDGIGQEYELDPKNHCAQIKVLITAHGSIAVEMLKYLTVGAFIGKLFAADERRRVRDPDYLSRMFGRADRWGKPLLLLGGLHGSNDLILDKVDGRTVAYLTLQNGRVTYDDSISGFLPTLGKALTTKLNTRNLLGLHQKWNPFMPRNIHEGEILLLRTLPLHIRTVFGHVVNDLLSHGYRHTTASVLQPDTDASGDIYELYGDSKREITDIPIEFYTLEFFREYVFFADRDQLQASLDNSSILFKTFETAPKPEELRAATFVVKGDQLLNLKADDWIVRETRMQEFPGISQGARQALMVERFISQQPAYPFLKAIDDGYITSQGVLFCRHFPSPFMKRMLLGDQVQRGLKGLYFQYPSAEHDGFFSSEDRALLHDLFKFGLPTFWVDQNSGKILQYVQKPERDSGLFVPREQIDTFLKSTLFGIYGSNLMEGDFAIELKKLLEGILAMRKEMNHPLLGPHTPLALVTGGGPGAMSVGNRVAREVGILSCANIVDFRPHDDKAAVVEEQHQNPFIDAKMTYRLDKLVERQAEFNLDFPIFLEGGIGTDFEYSLEEVRRKIGSTGANPILLFGDVEYWKQKVTSRYQCNLASGTIRGSEWVSNCFYCIQTAEQGLKVYHEFFKGTLPIGKAAPSSELGFVAVN
jgi:predicted Rossmann-fold nucleotide-binding protein